MISCAIKMQEKSNQSECFVVHSEDVNLLNHSTIISLGQASGTSASPSDRRGCDGICWRPNWCIL